MVRYHEAPTQQEIKCFFEVVDIDPEDPKAYMIGWAKHPATGTPCFLGMHTADYSVVGALSCSRNTFSALPRKGSKPAVNDEAGRKYLMDWAAKGKREYLAQGKPVASAESLINHYNNINTNKRKRNETIPENSKSRPKFSAW